MAKLDVTADQLRLGRIALRWSQSELARQSGLSRTTVANLLVDQRISEIEDRLASIKTNGAARPEARP